MANDLFSGALEVVGEKAPDLFGDALREVSGETRQDATLAAGLSLDLNPQAEAEYRTLSELTGAPVETIRADGGKTARGYIERQTYEGLPSHAVGTHRFMTSHNNAAIAQGDAQRLAEIETAVGELVDGPVQVPWQETFLLRQLESGQQQQLSGKLASQRQRTGETQTADELGDQLRAGAAQQEREDANLITGEVIGGAANMVGMLWEAFKGASDDAALGVAAGGTASLLAGPAAPIAAPAAMGLGAAAGMTYGMFREMYEAERGNYFQEAERVRGAGGEKLDPEVVETTATLYGFGSAVLETVSLGVLALPFRSLLKRQFQQGVLKQVTRREAVLKGLAQWQAAAGAEGLEEASQTALQGVLTNVAKSLSEGEFTPDSAGKIALEAGGAAVDAYLAAILPGALGPVMNSRSQLYHIDQADLTRAKLDALGGLVGDSKTYQRLPKATREHIESTLDAKGAASNVMVNAEAFRSHFQNDTDTVLQQLGVDVQAYRAALQSEGEFAIPLPAYAERVVGTEHHAALLDDMRLDNVEYTPRQAREAEKLIAENLDTIMDEAARIYEDERAQEEPVRKVFDQIYSDLTYSGRSAEQSRADAALATAMYRTLAAFSKDGLTAWDVFERRSLRTAGAPTAQQRLNFTEKEMAEATVADLEQNVKASGPVASEGQRLNATASGNSVVGQWYMDKGYATRDVIAALKKVAKGGKLTAKQTQIVEAWRAEQQRMGGEAFQSDPAPWKTKAKEAQETLSGSLSEAAKRFFGTTRNPMEAGYILADGTMLDFSGRHYAQDHPSLRNQRSVDHRELFGENNKGDSIEDMFPDDLSGSDAMAYFMAITGAVRFDAASGVVSAIGTPTQKQIAAIGSALKGESLTVSYINKETGKIVDEQEIDSVTPLSVKRFFENAVGKPDTSSYFQDAKDPLGKISFDYLRSTFTVEFFKKANASTFAHEMGHAYLEILNAMVETGEANDTASADLQRIFGWLGVEKYGQIDTPLHEKFADGFLNYLAEGRAPAEDLAPVFARFKSWLKRIFTQMKVQKVELSDDIRLVFDNMLSAGEDVQRINDREIFASAEDAGMTPEAWADYMAEVEASQRRAEEKHTASVLRAQLRADRQALRDEVAEEVRSRPAYQATERLRSDLMLDRDAVIALYGEVPDKLTFLTKKGGVLPEAAAEALGYATADEMVQTVIDAPTIEDAVRAETKVRMEEQYGATRDERVKSATDASHNARRLKVLGKRLQALTAKDAARRNVKAPTRDEVSAIKARVVEMIGNMRALELQPYQYVLAGRRAAKRVYAAVRKGDWAEAVKAQNAELVNHLLYVEASKAKADVDKARKLAVETMKAKTLGKLGLAGGEFLTWAQEVLSRYSFERLSNVQIARKNETLAAFLNSVAEMTGTEIPVDVRILDGQTINYKEATVAELRDMYATVHAIRTLAGKINAIRIGEENVAYEQLHGMMIEQINRLFPKQRPRRKTSGARSVGDSAKYLVEDVAFGIMRPQFLMEKLDGEEFGGLFHRVFWRQYNEGNLTENRLKAQILPMVNAALENSHKGRMQQQVYIKSLAQSYSVYDLVGMVLNMGNISNFDKLMRGGRMVGQNPVAFTGVQMEEVLNSLTKPEMDLVQSLWDMVETLKPEMAALQQRVVGVEPQWIEAQAVPTKHGVYRGGYWPIVFNPLDSSMGSKQEQSKSLAEAVEAVPFTKAFTKQGHLITRSEGAAAPLLTDWGKVLTRHLDNAIKDIAYREFLMTSRRALSQSVIDAVNDRVGEGYAREIEDWQKRVVGVEPMTQTAVDGLLRTARQNLTVAALGFKVANAIADAGITQLQAWSRVPAAEIIKAIPQYLFNVDGSRSKISELSPYMKHLWMSVDRDLSEGLKGLTGKTDHRAKLMRLAMQSRSFAYEIAAGNVWLAAYNDAHGNRKMSPDEAVIYADDVVRATSDAGRSGDVNRFEGSRNEWMRSFTLFLGPMTIAANSIAKAGRLARQGQVKAPLKTLIGFWVGNAILYEILVGRGPDEDDDWTWYAAKFAMFPFSSVPGVRDVATKVEKRLTGEYSFPREMPLYGAADALWKGAEDSYKYFAEDGDGDKAVKSMLRAFGLGAGLPTSQVEITGKYLYDVYSGEYEARHLWSPATDIFIRRKN